MKTLKESILESMGPVSEGLFGKIKSLFNRNGKQNKNTGTNTVLKVDVPGWLEEDIEHGMKRGWIYGDDMKKYGMSQENVFDLFCYDGGEVTENQVLKTISDAKAKGLSFKYDTIADFSKDHPEWLIHVGGETSTSKNFVNIPKWLDEDIEHGMRTGWILGDDGKKYGMSEENVLCLFCPDTPANVVSACISKLIKKGLDFKYHTTKELEDAGLTVYLG